MAKNFQTNLEIGGKLNPSLANTFNKVSQMANKSASTLSRVGDIAKGVFFGNVASKAFEKIASGVASISMGGVELASSLAEVQNVTDTTFGESAAQINQFSKVALQNFGLSELQAKKYSSTLGAMMKSSGLTGKTLVSMSQGLAGLSGDFSSFYNVAQDDAFGDLQSAMAGQTETMLKYGINMQIANLEQFALSKGIKTTYENMDQASKTALRYAYIMEKSKDAQGDFIKTQGSFANQTRLAKTNFQQLSAQIMSSSLPFLTAIAQKANDLMGELGMKVNEFNKYIKLGESPLNALKTVLFTTYGAETVEKINKIQKAIEDVAQGVQSVAKFVTENWSTIEPIIWGIIYAVGAYELATWGLVGAQKAAMIIEALSKAWQSAVIVLTWVREGESLATIAQIALNTAMAANPIGLVAVALMALGGVIYLIIQHWDSITTAVSNAWNWFTNLIKGMPDVALALAGPIAPILLLIKHFDKVKEVVGGAFDAVKKFFGFGKKDNGTKESAAVTFQSANFESNGMKKFATGGIATRPSIFGDAGPEIAIPLKQTSRSRMLLNQANNIIGGTPAQTGVKNSSMSLVINVYANSTEAPSIGQATKEAVKQALFELGIDGKAVNFA